jgi:YVTN family beta-propeller protein
MNIKTALLIVAVMAAWVSCDTTAEPPDDLPETDVLYEGPIYISNTTSATVTVIDGKTQTVTRTIDLNAAAGGGANQSHFISVTHNGRYLWVGERQGSVNGRTLVVDLEDGDKIVRDFNYGAHIGQHLSHDGKWLFAVAHGKGEVDGINYNNSILVYDVENLSYLGKIDHGSAPHVMETSPDGKTLWTTNAEGGKVIAYDISALPGVIPQTPSRQIDIAAQLKEKYPDKAPAHGVTLHAFAIHPAGKYLFVGSFHHGGMYMPGGGDVIVDIEKEEIVARIPGGPHNYDVSPDGKYLLSGESDQPDCEEAEYLIDHEHGGFTGPLVRIIDIAALSGADAAIDWDRIKVVNTIDSEALGAGSINHQAYTPDGKFIYVTTSAPFTSTTGNGIVLIVNADTLTLVKSIEVGRHPHGVVVPGYGR